MCAALQGVEASKGEGEGWLCRLQAYSAIMLCTFSSYYVNCHFLISRHCESLCSTLLSHSLGFNVSSHCPLSSANSRVILEP